MRLKRAPDGVSTSPHRMCFDCCECADTTVSTFLKCIIFISVCVGDGVCVCVWGGGGVRESMCIVWGAVCVRERVCVGRMVSVCVCERDSVCVCVSGVLVFVCVREREKERMCVSGDGVCVCVRETEKKRVWCGGGV